MSHLGKTHVYTGNGKGKTTAAVGLAVRAAGAGLRVYLGQFMKNNATGELAALRTLGVVVQQYGTGDELSARDPAADAHAAQEGFIRAREVLMGGDFDVVILDEANVADHVGYLAPDALVELVRARPSNVELVLTGRYASEKLMSAADLVTEMREVKHYFTNGVEARRGIEF